MRAISLRLCALVILVVALLMPWRVSAQPKSVFIFDSAATKQYFADAGGNYQRLINPWIVNLERIRQPYERISSNQLAQLVDRKAPGVLILPSVVALSSSEREHLKALKQRGWSFMATWALGGRDEAGQWIGYGFLEEFMSLKVVGSHDTRTSNGWFMFTSGESPVTHGLPAGQRIYFPKFSEPILLIQATDIVARGGDWMRMSGNGHKKNGLITYGEDGQARWLYWSFAETGWDTAGADIDRLLRNGLSWLKGEPAAFASAWPHPFQAAYLIEMDTEDQFHNAQTFAEMMEARRWVGTFYMLTSMAKANTATVQRLLGRHELAYHAEVHDGFKDLAAGVQESRLRNMQKDMASLIGDTRQVRGFRAPLESYDLTTEKLLRQVGVTHHAASMDASEDLLPAFSKAEPQLGPRDALVVFPRGLLDDINFLRMGLNDTARIQNLLIEDADKIFYTRGFGLLSIHSQYMAKESPLARAMPALLDHLARPDHPIWVAPASQIENWWRAREQVKSEVTIRAGQLNIRLWNQGEVITNYRIVLIPPKFDVKPTIVGKSFSGPGAPLLARMDDQRWALVFPQLQPGTLQLGVSFR